MGGEQQCVLRARDIRHSFPGVRALDGVDLCLRAGEVHALMGQNGAGKSTLIKVLTGACTPDGGALEFNAQPIALTSTLHAQQLGISTVYQEINLCPNLSAAENIVAGRYPRRAWQRGGGIDWREVNIRAQAALSQLQIDIDVTRQLSSYSIAVQQMVAIARATSIAAHVLILDEPTSSLDDSEVQQLFAVIKQLRQRGLAILFVTHFLDQVYAIADRITVLRNGGLVGEHRTNELDRSALIAAMVGHGNEDPTKALMPDTVAHTVASERRPLLNASGIGRRGKLHTIDLDIGAGEVVGLAGLLGSGRSEVARMLFGLDKPDAGAITIDGKPVQFTHPGAAVRCGLGFCPEERKTEGIVAELSIRDNIVLALQARIGWWPLVPQPQQRELAQRYINALGIKTSSMDALVGQLSGGNQQKVILARWLATTPRLLILDEPTRGIDIAAKEEIMGDLLKLARAGMSILFISAEIDEVVHIADRIVVMRDRRKVGELPGSCNEHDVYQMIAS